MKRYDFIFTGLQRWDIPIGSNAKDMALEISKENRVLYVNTPCKGKVSAFRLEQVAPMLWVLDVPVLMLPINFLPDNFLFDWANWFNQQLIVRYIRKAIAALGMSEYILFTDNDVYNSFYMPELLNPQLSIYYKRDEFVRDYWMRHYPRLEPLICRKYNLSMTNSEAYAEGIRGYNPKTTFIGQGMDVEKYRWDVEYPVPEDMLSIKRPIIGYIGYLTDLRLDMELIYETAVALSEYSFVMVGLETDAFKQHRLHSLPNVFFLGQKREEMVKNYIASFDVCLNPQLINKATQGNYPRKIDEYLAMGKPVVASRTRAMEYFGEYVYGCRSVQEYVETIRKVVASGFEVERRADRAAFAQSHSWENCVKTIYSILKKELN